MATVLEDPREAVDAITHQSENKPSEEHSVQEQHAPGPQTAQTSGGDHLQPRAETFERPLTKEEVLRPAFGALSTTLGCAFLVGGMFVGVTPRIYAAIAGIVGVGLAVVAARVQKRAAMVQMLTFFGILLLGVIMISISDFGALGKLPKLVGDAAKNARLRRPPAPFDEGWKAILPWTVGMVGYSSAWIGSMGRKPAVGVLIPIPVIAFAAIAQPTETQAIAGIVAFVSFVVGLTVIYRADRGEGSGVSTAYELKRAARAAPLVIALIVALVALAQTNLLFPKPLYDPTQRAQLPHSVPLSGVKDRVLFTTEATLGFTGPWRLGVLDVYDGENWRLPPYASSKLKDAPSDGVLDATFGTEVRPPFLRADVTISDLEGTKVPLPARTHAFRGDHLPQLVVDKRSESIGVKEGQVAKKLKYTVFFGLLPTVNDLRADNTPIDQDISTLYLDLNHATPPPAVKALIDEATKTTHNLWDRLDFIRQKWLNTVIAKGVGLPVAVPPSKIQAVLGSDASNEDAKKATPYEIIAAQAVMARWAGIPARIGYGFDKGDKVGTSLEFHPKHGSAWLEVYFQGFGWFPVTGFPKQADFSFNDPNQKVDAPVLPSDQIQVKLYIPLRVKPGSILLKQIQYTLLLALPFAIVFLLVWLLWPVVYKSRRRSRRRQWALETGRVARIAVAYAELRDMATDLGVGDPYGTPLAYLSKVVADEEHRELAWLVTRCLWGDLRDAVTDDEVFAAEELSRSLRRRLSEAQPFTIRGIALVSRLSLRNPYAPELLSPAMERVDVRKKIRVLASKLGKPRLPRRARERTMPDEAIENA